MNLVIHPEDDTTLMLNVLYEGVAAKVISSPLSRRQMRSCIRNLAVQDRIFLLGHGSAAGLLYRSAAVADAFSGLVISHAHAFPLRQHGANLVGIWCHAVAFARRERLHGLFSGMIITELSEAREQHVATTQAELECENLKLFRRFRCLLDANVPLADIPGLMPGLDDTRSELTVFNYKSFFYL